MLFQLLGQVHVFDQGENFSWPDWVPQAERQAPWDLCESTDQRGSILAGQQGHSHFVPGGEQQVQKGVSRPHTSFKVRGSLEAHWRQVFCFTRRFWWSWFWADERLWIGCKEQMVRCWMEGSTYPCHRKECTNSFVNINLFVFPAFCYQAMERQSERCQNSVFAIVANHQKKQTGLYHAAGLEFSRLRGRPIGAFGNRSLWVG